jgi:hypothetical protein
MYSKHANCKLTYSQWLLTLYSIAQAEGIPLRKCKVILVMERLVGEPTLLLLSRYAL